MSRVQSLMESNEMRGILMENQGLINEATELLGEFYGAMDNYIRNNIVDFLDESLEETAKNIYTFSTFATRQMLTEIATVYGQAVHQKEIIKEAERNEFA